MVKGKTFNQEAFRLTRRGLRVLSHFTLLFLLPIQEILCASKYEPVHGNE